MNDTTVSRAAVRDAIFRLQDRLGCADSLLSGTPALKLSDRARLLSVLRLALSSALEHLDVDRDAAQRIADKVAAKLDSFEAEMRLHRFRQTGSTVR